MKKEILQPRNEGAKIIILKNKFIVYKFHYLAGVSFCRTNINSFVNTWN